MQNEKHFLQYANQQAICNGCLQHQWHARISQ